MALGIEAGIAQELSDNSFGTFDVTSATSDIRIGEEPDSPDNVVTVLVTPGGETPNVVSEKWFITVRVRDTSYETGSKRLHDISVFLQEKEQGFFGAIKIARLVPAASPAPLGRDIKNRFRIEQIFETLIKSSFAFS